MRGAQSKATGYAGLERDPDGCSLSLTGCGNEREILVFLHPISAHEIITLSRCECDYASRRPHD
jgi:hypothetical protein